MSKRIISLFIIFCVIFAAAFPALASDENLILNGSFESNEPLWDCGEITSETAYNSSSSLCISSSVSSDLPNGVLYVSEYLPDLYIEEGYLYSLSFMICCDGAEPSDDFEKTISFSHSSNRILAEISNPSCDWTPVTLYFAADKSASYGLALMLYAPFDDCCFYIDDITLSRTSYTPVSMKICGATCVYIPESGECSYEYYPIMIDSSQNIIPLITGEISLQTDILGVYFDSEQSCLIVSSSAVPDTNILLTCNIPDAAYALPLASFTVTLDKNMIPNGNFENPSDMISWTTDGNTTEIIRETQSSYAALTPSYTNDGYSCCLSASNTFVLQSDNMYVFRADVKSKVGSVSADAPESEITVDEANGIIDINIYTHRNVNWTNIFSAITTISSGIYDVRINVYAPDSYPVFVDNIRFSSESSLPSSVAISAPRHICSDENSLVPYKFAVLDQIGNPISFDADTYITPENLGVSCDGNYIHISKNAACGTYTLHAQSTDNPLAKGTHSFVLSENAIGDGSFEDYSSKLWATSAPSEFNKASTFSGFYPTSGSNFGKLIMNSPVSILYSDSVKTYKAATSYIFTSSMVKTVSDIDTVVTVLIADVNSQTLDDSIIAAQFDLSNSISEVERIFTPSSDITGRLMIAFTTPAEHDSQIILLDDISIETAQVFASSVSISGSPYPDMMISGKYKFGSNFNAIDASAFRWLMSSDENGVYIPISGQTQQTLSITSDMTDKYIKFEVTPISLNGPVSGACVVSRPVRIGCSLPEFSDETSSGINTPDSDILPENEADTNSSEQNQVIKRGNVSVVNLSCFVNSASSVQYFDMQGHWAYSDIKLMTAAGIAAGRGDGIFSPSAPITRAEFSAFLIRAFNLAPLYYEGSFTDVKPWDWYSGVVETITKYNIAYGTGENTFSPDIPITREQMASMIMRAFTNFNLPVSGNGTYNFLDLNDVSTYALSDIKNISALKIFVGMPDGKFYPKRNATRAEAIVAIKRMIEAITELSL